MSSQLRGRFITLEGGEGAGKTTQRARLVHALRHCIHQADGKPITVVSTREPGGSNGAELIRNLLVSGDVERWDVKTEALLHVAARRDHLVKTILPALNAGTWVVCDRFADSTTAYQGYGHGVDLNDLAYLHTYACNGLLPDLTLIIDVPVSRGLSRARNRQQSAEEIPETGRAGGAGVENRYELMDVGFHERVRQGFLTIAEKAPDRCRVLDGDRDEDSVHASILGEVFSFFPDLILKSESLSPGGGK